MIAIDVVNWDDPFDELTAWVTCQKCKAARGPLKITIVDTNEYVKDLEVKTI
jgi:hypothetical protein